MLKKILVMGVMVIMVLGLFGCGGSKDDWTLVDSINCCPYINPELSETYWVNHQKSSIAYEEVLAYFTLNDGKHTDDFGGVFVDNQGIFNICVVGKREPVQSDYLIYKRVANSLNTLDGIVAEISGVMQEFSVWMVSTCETCNKVMICIEDESKISSLIEHLKSKNLFSRGTLNIFVGENQIVSN